MSAKVGTLVWHFWLNQNSFSNRKRKLFRCCLVLWGYYKSIWPLACEYEAELFAAWFFAVSHSLLMTSFNWMHLEHASLAEDLKLKLKYVFVKNTLRCFHEVAARQLVSHKQLLHYLDWYFFYHALFLFLILLFLPDVFNISASSCLLQYLRHFHDLLYATVFTAVFFWRKKKLMLRSLSKILEYIVSLA